jgi:hypothetical protein
MKKNLLVFAFFVSTIIFSSPSYAEWSKVAENISGDEFYMDFDRIRKYNGDVYVWFLYDYLKPRDGILSVKIYMQVDCNLLRNKELSISAYTVPMGSGTSEFTVTPQNDWDYPSPDSSIESMLNLVCSQ